MKIIKRKSNIYIGDVFIVIDTRNKYKITNIYNLNGHNYFSYKKMGNNFELYPYECNCTEEHMNSIINKIIEFI